MSKLLSMMMSSSSGVGTLNAEIVGTPTISDDWILSNFDSSNYLKFVPTTSNLTDFTFTTKFKVSDLSKEGHIFQCVPDQSGINFGYATDGSGTNGLSVLVTDHSNTSYWGNAINGTTGYRISNAYTVANQWMWIKIEVTNGQDIKVYSSTDGTTYTKIHDVTAIYGTGNFGQLQYEIIGGNEAISTGIEIDLKEVKMYVDGTLFWEAVSFGGGGIDFKTSIYTLGNAYISLDLSSLQGQSVKCRLKGECLDFSNLYYLFGYSSGSSYNSYQAYFYNGSVEVGDNSQAVSVSSPSFDITGQAKTMNNNYLSDFRLFSWKYGSTINFTSGKCKFSLFEILDSNDNILHQLKPAIVNGESGMYDTVTETFYGNSNSVGSLVCE